MRRKSHHSQIDATIAAAAECLVFLGCAAACLCAAAAAAQPAVPPGEEETAVPGDFSVRLRVVRLDPPGPVCVQWRWGGEGLGGEVHRGEWVPELALGQWAPWAPVDSIWGPLARRKFVTFTVSREQGEGRQRVRVPLSGVVLEFQFAFGGRIVKSLSEAGPDGGTVGIGLPGHLLEAGKSPNSPEVLAEIEGISAYVRRRRELLEGMPWAKEPVPQRYAIVTDVGGYGEQSGYGIRHTNLGVVRDECRILRLLGVNGLRSGFDDARKAGADTELRRAHIGRAVGYMLPDRGLDAGCPHAPGIEEARATAAREALAQLRQVPADEIWALTVDEIGAIAKEHLAECSRCAEAFRRYLAGMGLEPADLGKARWADVAPVMIWAREGSPPQFDVGSAGTALQAYYTSRFVVWASARAFSDLTEAFRDEGMFSYALRGPTPTWRGHSLDFFEFYDHADSAIVFETSNRGPQVWQWESYMADICRGVAARRGLRFGCYVKPHRGAPIQRMLTAAARGAQMIYWYTYGPDYKKGDSFSQEPSLLEDVGRATRLLRQAEDVLYGSRWAARAQVAFVTPRASEVWGQWVNPEHGSAAWEDAKWVYLALAHAHLPVDVLSEYDLATDDLSRYRIIYVIGANLRRDAAEAVRGWVEAGGTLWTDAGGLTGDEANQPLHGLGPVLGLDRRDLPELWVGVPRYYATALQPFESPASPSRPGPGPALSVTATDLLPAGTFTPTVGGEVLFPRQGTDVLARYADGSVAATRHRHGNGQAIVLGTYQGLEYSRGLRRPDFDMRRNLEGVARGLITQAALAVTQPVVEPSDPLTEAVLVENEGRRAVVLMNWAYRSTGNGHSELEPLADASVLLRGVGRVRRARSVCCGPLRVSQRGADVLLALPRLAEGDVILLR